MPTWDSWKKTDEYKFAKQEIEALIRQRIAPLETEIGNLLQELGELKARLPKE